MIESLGGGLLIAFFSSLAFLAYNHPPQFRSISPYLYVATGAAYVILLTWSACDIYMSGKVHEFVLRRSGVDAANAVMQGFKEAKVVSWAATLIPPAFFFYLVILQILVTNLKKNDVDKQA